MVELKREPRLDAYTVKIAMECERVIRRSMMVGAYVEELLRRPYRPAPLPLIPVVEEQSPPREASLTGGALVEEKEEPAC